MLLYRAPEIFEFLVASLWATKCLTEEASILTQIGTNTAISQIPVKGEMYSRQFQLTRATATPIEMNYENSGYTDT